MYFNLERGIMSYTPTKPAMGYIQATPISTASINNVVFDIHNDMQTTETNGKTDLKSNAIAIMALSRDNDGSNYKSSAYQINATQTDLKQRGRIPSEVTNYMQISEYAMDYTDNVEPTESSTAGSGNISFTNHSHCRIWRLNT